MEGGGEQLAAPAPYPYTLPAAPFMSEDILFCVDIAAESRVEMKTLGSDGRPITRMDAIVQALTLFVNSKHTINPDHRFAFATLGRSFTWLRKEFNNDVVSATTAIRSLEAADSSYGHADLTQLFRIASSEAKVSQGQGRILRVVLIYYRSSTPPEHQYPVSPKLFTLDIIYLHDKPSPENCVQKVFDILVDALDHVSANEGYVFESSQSTLRVLLRYICLLLSHPNQRCPQDELDIPKPLIRKVPVLSDAAPSGESVPPSSR